MYGLFQSQSGDRISRELCHPRLNLRSRLLYTTGKVSVVQLCCLHNAVCATFPHELWKELLEGENGWRIGETGPQLFEQVIEEGDENWLSCPSVVLLR